MVDSTSHDIPSWSHLQLLQSLKSSIFKIDPTAVLAMPRFQAITQQPFKERLIVSVPILREAASSLKETSFRERVGWFYSSLRKKYTETVNLDRKKHHQTRSKDVEGGYRKSLNHKLKSQLYCNGQYLKPTRNAFQYISIKARLRYALRFLHRPLVPDFQACASQFV